jgi:hypothetical protein
MDARILKKTKDTFSRREMEGTRNAPSQRQSRRGENKEAYTKPGTTQKEDGMTECYSSFLPPRDFPSRNDNLTIIVHIEIAFYGG